MKRKAAPTRKTAAGQTPQPARLWLIRHAHALDASEDSVRPLSKRGRRQIRALAKFLGATGALHPAEIWHSPLVRSRQTAELLAGRLGLKAPLLKVAGLLPDDKPRSVAQRLKPLRHGVAIVGHEPHLSALAALLVTGVAAPGIFVFKKCAVLALERGAARWAVRWQVSPEVLA